MQAFAGTPAVPADMEMFHKFETGTVDRVFFIFSKHFLVNKKLNRRNSNQNRCVDGSGFQFLFQFYCSNFFNRIEAEQ